MWIRGSSFHLSARILRFLSRADSTAHTQPSNNRLWKRLSAIKEAACGISKHRQEDVRCVSRHWCPPLPLTPPWINRGGLTQRTLASVDSDRRGRRAPDHLHAEHIKLCRLQRAWGSRSSRPHVRYMSSCFFFCCSFYMVREVKRICRPKGGGEMGGMLLLRGHRHGSSWINEGFRAGLSESSCIMSPWVALVRRQAGRQAQDTGYRTQERWSEQE